MPSSQKPRARASTTCWACPTPVPSQSSRRPTANLCLWCHPDKTPHPRAADAFLLVCSAFELLSDPARRKAYDASLRPTIPKPAFAKPRVYEPVAAPKRRLLSERRPRRALDRRTVARRGQLALRPEADRTRARACAAAVRPLRAAKPRPRSAGVEQARRRSRERAAAAREQREAMEREAQGGVRKRSGVDRRAPTRPSARARRRAARAAATAQKRAAEARKKYAEASAKT